MKRPAFQFYPGDWQRDAALRMCSLSARGLWWEMICIMHSAEPYGHLVAAGQPITCAELARIVGESKGDVTKWLAELNRRQVYSVTSEGAIYSRRMVRDEIERKKWRDRQARHRDVTPDVTRDVTPTVTPVSPLSSDLRTSSSSSNQSQTHLSGKPDDPPPADSKKLNGSRYYADAESVLDYLNNATCKGFEFRNRAGELTTNADRIIQRLKQGYTAEELREVVHAKCEQWLHDDKMAEYLRPATLFAKENFEQYIGELRGGDVR